MPEKAGQDDPQLGGSELSQDELAQLLSSFHDETHDLQTRLRRDQERLKEWERDSPSHENINEWREEVADRMRARIGRLEKEISQRSDPRWLEELKQSALRRKSLTISKEQFEATSGDKINMPRTSERMEERHGTSQGSGRSI